MGCKHACVCGGNYLGCTSYEKEEYCGQAEDERDELYGNNYDENEEQRKDYFKRRK